MYPPSVALQAAVELSLNRNAKKSRFPQGEALGTSCVLLRKCDAGLTRSCTHI
jgi:hypothetical protein